MKNPMKPLIALALSLCAVVSLCACESERDKKLEQMDAESKGGVVQSYTSDELKELNGAGFFKDYYTFDEILDEFETGRGSYVDGRFTKGGYVVDADSPLKPGTYYFQGSQTTLNSIYLFNPFTGSAAPTNAQTYLGRVSLQYIGFYLVELEQGEVIVFDPEDDEFMMWEAPAGALGVDPPYASGAYRVGIDIPPGVYTVSVEEEALVAQEKSVEGNPGAYVMSNMSFPKDESNIIQEYILTDEEPVQQVEVQEGQWLELYAAIATP